MLHLGYEKFSDFVAEAQKYYPDGKFRNEYLD
jgi:hypothetical protein